MARVANVEIPNNKKVKISLTYVYGIGNSLSLEILSKAKVDPEKFVEKLDDKELTDIRNEVSKIPVEGVLRREKQYSIKRLMEIGCYRGIRHRKGLPVRGQSTRKNARTRKGNKKTVANKKKAPTT